MKTFATGVSKPNYGLSKRFTQGGYDKKAAVENRPTVWATVFLKLIRPNKTGWKSLPGPNQTCRQGFFNQVSEAQIGMEPRKIQVMATVCENGPKRAIDYGFLREFNTIEWSGCPSP